MSLEVCGVETLCLLEIRNAIEVNVLNYFLSQALSPV